MFLSAVSTYTKCNAKEGKILKCTNPSYCDATCQNPNPNCAEYRPCYTRCVCKQGLVLDKKRGRCIKYKDCPKNIAEGKYASQYACMHLQHYS